MSVEKNYYEFKVPPQYLYSCPNVGARYGFIEDPHITLLYGFDPKHWDEIDKYVKENFNWEKELESRRIEFGRVTLRLAEFGNHVVVNVKNRALENLFYYLYTNYPNEHHLINGQFIPHVTLKYVKKADACYWLNDIDEILILD